jgi:single-strand DNA-binding protein
MLKLLLIGNLGSDPEMRYSANGSPMLRFNVAGNYRAKGDSGEWEEKTEWVRVTVFGTRADSLSQILRKGTKVYADGRLEARPWTDNNGNVKAGLELVADTVELCSPRPQDDGQQMRAPNTVNRPATQRRADDADLEEVPF